MTTDAADAGRANDPIGRAVEDVLDNGEWVWKWPPRSLFAAHGRILGAFNDLLAGRETRRDLARPALRDIILACVYWCAGHPNPTVVSNEVRRGWLAPIAKAARDDWHGRRHDFDELIGLLGAEIPALGNPRRHDERIEDVLASIAVYSLRAMALILSEP